MILFNLKVAGKCIVVCKEYTLLFRLIIYVLYSFTHILATFYMGLRSAHTGGTGWIIYLVKLILVEWTPSMTMFCSHCIIRPSGAFTWCKKLCNLLSATLSQQITQHTTWKVCWMQHTAKQDLLYIVELLLRCWAKGLIKMIMWHSLSKWFDKRQNRQYSLFIESKMKEMRKKHKVMCCFQVTSENCYCNAL